MTEVLWGLGFLLFLLVAGVWAYATGARFTDAGWQVLGTLFLLALLLGAVIAAVRGLWSILTAPFGG